MAPFKEKYKKPLTIKSLQIGDCFYVKATNIFYGCYIILDEFENEKVVQDVSGKIMLLNNIQSYDKRLSETEFREEEEI